MMGTRGRKNPDSLPESIDEAQGREYAILNKHLNLWECHKPFKITVMSTRAHHRFQRATDEFDFTPITNRRPRVHTTRLAVTRRPPGSEEGGGEEEGPDCMIRMIDRLLAFKFPVGTCVPQTRALHPDVAQHVNRPTYPLLRPQKQNPKPVRHFLSSFLIRIDVREYSSRTQRDQRTQ